MSCNVVGVREEDDGERVSIPIGFSNELQQEQRQEEEAVNRPRFQSLSGFPMSCNGVRGSRVKTFDVFQSLSGFPMSCNSPSVSNSEPPPGFNPYRVFQ